MVRLFLIILSTILLSTATHAQLHYWVQFNTKTGTPYSFNNPEAFLSPRSIERRTRQGIEIDSTDLPVNPAFIDSLNLLRLHVKHTSRWLNGAIVTSTDTALVSTLDYPSFIDTIQLRKPQPLKSSFNKFSDEDSLIQNHYGESYNQITMLNGQLVHEESTGKGVWVAVIDAGFLNADSLEVFDSLYARNGILGTRDFVNPGGDVYDSHYHGTAVLSVMAANQTGSFVGTAPDASYWLLRTEDAPSEYPVEEDYWIIAAEFADSVGCDVLNTSLGYTIFDDNQFNHTYSQFDGNTLRISKAANLAVDKGMVVVCSAGNSGNDNWRYISAPSEAEDVLSVGAVNANRDTVRFSSAGFAGASVPKPDIAAMGSGTTVAYPSGDIVQSSGTSFSSPVIAGMAACLVGMYPEKTATEIIDLIRKSGDLYPGHNVKTGYGIPDFSTLFKGEGSLAETLNNTRGVLPNPFSSYLIINDSQVSSIDLYNNKGIKVLELTKTNNQKEFSSEALINLPKGMYFAILKGKDKLSTVKLIKE
ncbi:MAG TPA: S8 family serine peptidase [Prolixibacteraceae bacterium]|nr:S8 family serine peptidase [Prolixibacteraceae bacterium]